MLFLALIFLLTQKSKALIFSVHTIHQAVSMLSEMKQKKHTIFFVALENSIFEYVDACLHPGYAKECEKLHTQLNRVPQNNIIWTRRHGYTHHIHEPQNSLVSCKELLKSGRLLATQKPIIQDLAAIFAQIKSYGVILFGLIVQDDEDPLNYRVQQFLSLVAKYDLSLTELTANPSFPLLPGDETLGIFKHGILVTKQKNLTQATQLFVDQLGHFITRICYFDHNYQNLLCLQKLSGQRTTFSFTGWLYQQSPTKPFHEGIARYQFLSLSLNREWLSDEDVQKKLH